MKFSELNRDEWAELQPYLDTCLLPVTGLAGHESPPEALELVAAAGQWLAPLEAAFRGRTVTMPAYHYGAPGDEAETARLERHLAAVKRAGFRFAIVATGLPGIGTDTLPSADLIVGPGEPGAAPDPKAIKRAVTELWQRASS